jgi:hypothetical protein
LYRLPRMANYPTRHVTSNNLSAMSVKTDKTVYINYTGTLCITTCWHPQTKHKFHPKVIFTSTRSSVHFPITCYNLPTNQQRFDSRGVTDIQYC